MEVFCYHIKQDVAHGHSKSCPQTIAIAAEQNLNLCSIAIRARFVHERIYLSTACANFIQHADRH
jgi:hypothetical protein